MPASYEDPQSVVSANSGSLIAYTPGIAPTPASSTPAPSSSPGLLDWLNPFDWDLGKYFRAGQQQGQKADTALGNAEAGVEANAEQSVANAATSSLGPILQQFEGDVTAAGPVIAVYLFLGLLALIGVYGLLNSAR